MLRLARWQNALIAAAGVALGAWWADWGESVPIVAAMAGAVALTVAANAWNDASDVEIDRVAHPRRPLPAGDLSREAAMRLADAAAAAAVIATTVVGTGLGLLSVLVLFVMWVYSPWLKRHGLVGNIVVAVLASLPFLYGSWAAGRAAAGLPLVALAAPLHFAREIAKDLDDAPADAALRRTLPVAGGARAARGVFLIALLGFALLLAPFMAMHPRFALAILPAIVLMIWAAILVLRGGRGSPIVFKIAMLCAMAAVLLARS
jgi:geranylgeranylglycerol-phosphate geranylgeranyltransferase